MLPESSRVRACLVLLALSAPLMADRPPNVVVIFADDVGYECFGAYGSKQYRTPRIDSLADSGALFSNCYSTPLCTPSRVALMTGKGNARNYADFGVLLPDEYTIADLFRNAGYATAVAGKWQLQGSAAVKGTPAGQGFDTYCLWNTGNTARTRYWNPSVECDGEILDTDDGDYGPDIMASFLLRFIEDHRDRPFFAYYPMVLPHSPFRPTPLSASRDSKDEQRNFEDMVAYIDFVVGRIQDRLEALGLLSDTVIVFTSDNGSHYSLVSELDGIGITGDKGSPTDAGTHVPLVVSAPGRIEGGQVIDDLIDFTDFLPTLAHVAGLDLPDGLGAEGVSFWKRLQGKAGNPRRWLFTYYFPRPYAASFETPYTHPEVRYVRDKRYKLYATGELFDVKADPLETKPIGSADGATAAALAKLREALESAPSRGMRIPDDRSDASKAFRRPRWHPD